MRLQAAVTSCYLAISALAATPGISLPANGTSVAPGETFDFKYNSVADYGVSSYNFTVWLMTSVPTSFFPSGNFASGHYFGRFGLPNYPGNPFPENPPPSQLVMPDFSKSLGGFGAGKSASNAITYLTVLEEYANGDGVLGYRFSLVANQLIYNVTTA